MDIALFENAKFGDIFITTEKKQAVFLRLAENAEYKFAFLYIEDWGIVQVFRHNGKEIHNDVAHSVVGKYENPVGEEFEKALAEEWKGYTERGAATVDALEDNTQELAFAKGFYRGWYYRKEPVSNVWHDMSESVENGRNIIIIDPADFYGAVLRKGGSQLKNHNKERYVKWGYIDDLQNLSNVERTTKKSNASEVTSEVTSEVSEDLEEAADNCYFRNHAHARESFIEGANWQKEKDDKLFTIVYMDGLEKGKQQMVKDSISATIESDLDPLWAVYGKQKIVCKWGELEAKKFKEGDKVKLIIIKED